MGANLTAIFSARDRMSGQLNQMANSGNKFTNVLKKVALAGAAAFSIKAAYDFGKNSVMAFAEFESKINEVFTMLPNISQQGMDDMTEQVKKFSKDFGVLPEKVVPALYQALSAGVPENNVFQFMEVAQKAALGGVTQLETAVDGITSVVNSYGADMVSASQASDLMFTTVRLGKTNFEQLSQSLFNVLPSAAAAGVKFQDVSAALAAVTAQGVPTSVASTKIRAAIDEMSKAGTKTSDTFKQLSGKTFKQFIAGGGNLQQALQLMEKHAKSSGLGVNDLFSSVEAGSAALSLTGKGTEKFASAMKEMQKSAGATDAAYKKMDRGLKRTLDRVKANFDVSMINLGDKLAPFVEKAANTILALGPKINKATKILYGHLKDFLSPTIEFLKVWGDGVKRVFKGEGWASAFQSTLNNIDTILFEIFDMDTAIKVSEVFWSMTKEISKALDNLKAIVKNQSKNLLLSFDSLAHNPALIKFIKDLAEGLLKITQMGFQNIVALKDAIIELSTKVLKFLTSPQLQDFVGTTIGLISTLVSYFVDTLAPVMVTVFQFIMDTVVKLGAYFLDVVQNNILPFVTAVIQAFQEYILPIVTDVIDIIVNDVLPLFMDAISFVTDTLLPILQDTFDRVFPYLSRLVEDAFIIIQGVWNNILKPVIDAIVFAFAFAWPYIKGIVEVSVRVITDVISGILQTFTGVIDFLVGVFTGDWGKAWQGIKDIFAGIFNSLAGVAKAPINSVIGLINGAMENIHDIGFTVPDWVPGDMKGKEFRVPLFHIPMLAKGTKNWPGGPAMIGETGLPEIVTGPTYTNLPKGSNVIGVKDTSKILGATQNSNASGPQDNRQYIINLPGGQQVGAENKQDFIAKVRAALEKILDDDNTTGGDLAFDY